MSSPVGACAKRLMGVCGYCGIVAVAVHIREEVVRIVLLEIATPRAACNVLRCI